MHRSNTTRIAVAVTTHIKHGYTRRNGVPQSDRTTLTEYFEDPMYLRTPLYVSSDFKKLPDGRTWKPTPCVYEWGPLRMLEDTNRFQ